MWADLLNAGVDRIKQEARSRLAIRGTSAHIAGQNDAVAEMGAVLSDYQAGRLRLEDADYRITKIAAAFQMFASELGYERALRGASEVASLATRIKNDMRSGAVRPGVPSVPVPGIGSVSPVTLALIGIGAYFFLKRR